MYYNMSKRFELHIVNASTSIVLEYIDFMRMLQVHFSNYKSKKNYNQ